MLSSFRCLLSHTHHFIIGSARFSLLPKNKLFKPLNLGLIGAAMNEASVFREWIGGVLREEGGGVLCMPPTACPFTSLHQLTEFQKLCCNHMQLFIILGLN